uniref:GumC family protein n=1 Tax=Aliiroseovarius sp. TaxID=1872442 RepID=UPI0026041D29
MTSHSYATAQFGPRDVVAILRRRLRLILFTIGTVLTITLGILLLVSPRYTATALLLVDPSQKNLLAPDEARQSSGATESARVDSEIEIARSGAILLATVQTLNLVTDPEFGPSIPATDKLRAAIGLPMSDPPPGQDLLNDTLRKLASATTVRRRGLTYVFEISVTADNPDRAATLANAMAQTYIDMQIRSKKQSVEAARDLLLAQVTSARTALAASNDAFDQYLRDNLDQLISETDDAELRDLQSSLLTLNAARRRVVSSLEESQAALDAGNWAALSDNLQNEALAALNTQRRELEARLAGVTQDSDSAFGLRASLEQLETRLKDGAALSIQGLRDEIGMLDARGDALNDDLREAVLGSNLSSTTLAYLYELQAGAEIAQRQYSNLLSRLRDLEAQALVQVADSRVVSHALAPNQPSFPNTRLTLVMAFLSAIGVAVSLAF